VLERCKDRGLLLGKGGLYGNTIRLKPPMCITKDDANFIIDCLDEVLSEITA
jgi:alanine-glyoxylate transaminase / (R)-3-amino-2-methylpropionate-pyruvate transaminase